MKRLLPFLLFAGSAWATITDVAWREDSLNAFRVDLTGVGMSFYETLTSPSGLWDVYAKENASYFDGSFLFSDGSTSGILHEPGGPHYLFTQGYTYPTPVSKLYEWPIETHWQTGGYYLNDFAGDNILFFTEVPDLLDPSTWSWRATYQASKPVPEAGNTLLYMAFGLMVLSATQWRGKA